jgi:3-isopropylmalate/(R)-2-methylmalate dehydratase large subunit
MSEQRPMNIVEKVFSQHQQGAPVGAGDLVVVGVDRVILIDLNFYKGLWFEPKEVFDPEKVVITFDHVVPAHDRASAEYLERGRKFAARVGIERLHDIGRDQGISHQLVAEVPYVNPGQILVCTDSHTCSAGALNAVARGLGVPEIAFILAKGFTWFIVGESVRYELTGSLPKGVTGKDLLLHIGKKWGSHEGQNVELGGPGLSSLSIDRRREVTTMCAEISADFAVCEPDQVLLDYLAVRDADASGATVPDADATYADVRTVDLDRLEPMVALPGGVIDNTVPVGECAGRQLTHAFIGSCASGTLDDMREAARILDGGTISDDVTLVVTPASQEIYREAVKEGLVEKITAAGGLFTASSCGMCGGFDNTLTANAVCISSSTRNFSGRMGDPAAKIYLASSATVAASALMGEIVGEASLEASAVPS